MRPYLLSLAATRTRLIFLTQGLSPQGRWAGRQLILSAVSLLASLSPDAARGPKPAQSCLCQHVKDRCAGLCGRSVASPAAPEWRITDSNR